MKKNLKQKINKKSGTTLIEIMLYFGILAIVLVALLNFAIQIINLNKLSDNSNEMQVTLDFLANRISTVIEAADSINNGSVFDNNQGILSLNVPAAEDSPTRFYFSNGDIFIQEGLASAIKINSDNLKVNSFRVHKISSTKTPDQIILDIEIAPKYAEISNLDKTSKLHQTFSLRRL